ncbi:MAG TPA: permease prefix domain 2-containing transporter, partial [Ohtaekwangia sp.]|uniref:permease prefix domain 2-containing transporter n=1 Tax=Ohtaekwangia sp. TaxID=2066019 RepID=UPI002F92BA27
MKQSPPRWADRFLKWYCRYDMLEEIQGDVYELYHRTVQQSKLKADILFVWNVLRFFRWRNIYKRNPQHLSPISAAMIKNMLIIAVRNFFRQPVHSMFNVIGLSVSFAGAFLVLLWVSFEFSFDTFHNETDQLFQVVTHVDADGNIQSYDAASVSMDVSSVPEINMMVSASTGSRWPHVLCFRPDENNKECVYINGIYANENLFSVFNFSIVQGDQHPLKRPDQIAVSEKMASLLFNTNNVVGKTLKVDGTHEVTITSVFKDVPANSSLQFDFVMPYAILQKLWGTTPEGFAENFFNVYIKT